MLIRLARSVAVLATLSIRDSFLALAVHECQETPPDEHGSQYRAAGPTRRSATHLGRRARDRPAGDAAVLASAGIPAPLGAEVGTASPSLAARRRDHRPHQADGAT